MKCDQDECIERYGSSIGDDPGLLYRPQSILMESSRDLSMSTKGGSKQTEHASM